MGGFTTIAIGMLYPQRALSLTAAGAGSGSERKEIESFRKNAPETAGVFETKGSEHVARTYGMDRRAFRFW
jgi:3-oxoadipate enol-lactonase